MLLIIWLGHRDIACNFCVLLLQLPESGWAVGCVVGPVYLLRTDGKDRPQAWCRMLQPFHILCLAACCLLAAKVCMAK
jgi:hypothetical protein